MVTQPVFDPSTYLASVGKRLVFEFEHAGQAGTPGLIGGAREHPAREQLRLLLPGAAGVGSGIVVDGFRSVSRQQDIVVYEKDACPVFSINGTSEATYFPVEGVVAVGEVKSSLGTKELEDAFTKIRSVKSLRRFVKPEVGLAGDSVPFRSFGSSLSIQGTPGESYDQDSKVTDQVFGFILCQKFALTQESLLARAAALWTADDTANLPNMLVSLSDGVVVPANGNQLISSAHGADSIMLIKPSTDGFPMLIRWLNNAWRIGRTVENWAFDRYFDPSGSAIELEGVRYPFPRQAAEM